MTTTPRAPWNETLEFTPTPRDVNAMAEVLEGKHGAWAASIADFFAVYHGERGDANRSSAWSGVAELVRNRERDRLENL
ncbi:hypothetical protein DLM45_09685 [Hyphomicrobium methylovorum]|uniref:hypothetical protein n=1 Tax=Hyphomicrobium methylovorum TaxID=84 RepID=UPI0015E6AF3F|nr:hypothetical protein [Hyphomicrobium methylovorum]MBA2126489.1 hypothetical protein [Hyphomicrobium methylovorum]